MGMSFSRRPSFLVEIHGSSLVYLIVEPMLQARDNSDTLHFGGVRFLMDGDNDQTIRYMQQVIAWQPRLYAFILSLTGDPNEGDDVLQNANVALLQKQKAFRPDANFGAGPCKSPTTRSNDIGTPRPTRRRFDNALLDQLAAKMGEIGSEPGLELLFLRECMARLSARERNAYSSLRRPLGAGDRGKWDRPAGSVSQTLYRIRSKLADASKRPQRGASR